jgi:hypothetical protein
MTLRMISHERLDHPANRALQARYFAQEHHHRDKPQARYGSSPCPAAMMSSA